MVRSGPAFALSLVLSSVEPALRSAAELGAWQIISPVSVAGKVVEVQGLHEVQDTVRCFQPERQHVFKTFGCRLPSAHCANQLLMLASRRVQDHNLAGHHSKQQLYHHVQLQVNVLGVF